MMSFNIILEYRELVTQKDIYGGNAGSIGRWIGAAPGGVLGYGIGQMIGRDPDDKVAAMIGTGIGAALGGQIGKYVGRRIAPDPESPADFKNPLHRTGYLAMPTTSPHGVVGDMILPSPLLTSLGVHTYNAISDNGAKRLGYDKLGRVAEIAVGPFIGLVSPGKIKKITKGQKSNYDDF